MVLVINTLIVFFGIAYYASKFLIMFFVSVCRRIVRYRTYDEEAKMISRMRLEPDVWYGEEQHFKDLIEEAWKYEDHPTTLIYKEMKEDFDFIFEFYSDSIATNTDEKLANYYRRLSKAEKEDFIDWCTLLKVAKRGKGYFVWGYTDLRPNFARGNTALSFRACQRVEMLWRENGIDFHMAYDPEADRQIKPSARIFPEEFRRGCSRRI